MKKPLPEIFCSVSVLKDFWDSFNKINWDFENPDRTIYQLWYNLILNNSHLILDISEEEMQKLAIEHKFFISLIKKKQECIIEIEFFENIISTYLEEKRFAEYPKSIFLLNKTKENCETLEKLYGLLFLNKELMISKGKYIFYDLVFSFSKGLREDNDLKDWRNLCQLQLPCNELILLDNFLIKNDYGIRDNLLPILDGLLPKEMSFHDFTFILITINDDEKYIFQRYKKIVDGIKNILKRPYNINFFLLTTMKEFNHDRNMYSNYFWFNIGQGFDLFKGKECNYNTTLVIKSAFLSTETRGCLANTNYQLMYKEIIKVDKIIENHIQISCENKVEGKEHEKTELKVNLCKIHNCKPSKRMSI